MGDAHSPKRSKPAVEHASELPEVLDLEDDEGAHEADAVLEQELRSAQAELDRETEEMLEKMRQIEQEYNVRKKPLYKARGQIIQQIPGFWLHCLLQHEEIRTILGAVDQEILSSLTELEVDPFEGAGTGYKLTLRFAENPFFEDTELAKEIRFQGESDEEAPRCTVTGCSPRWRAGDLTQPETIKTGRKRGRDSVAFFRWFVQPNDFEPGLVDSLADMIKDQLWVNPLEFMDGEDDGEVDADAADGDGSDDSGGEVDNPDSASFGAGEGGDDGTDPLADPALADDAELEDYEEDCELEGAIEDVGEQTVK